MFVLSTQWQQLRQLGEGVDDSVIEERLATISPDKCAAVIYTVYNIPMHACTVSL